jgi:hypothetical protein
MRTTIDMPEPLHRIAMGLARHTGRTFSQTLVDLIERGLAMPPGVQDAVQPASTWQTHPRTGLPVSRSRRLVTPQDVAELEDDA